MIIFQKNEEFMKIRIKSEKSSLKGKGFDITRVVPGLVSIVLSVVLHSIGILKI